jgi:hypothetical protein
MYVQQFASTTSGNSLAMLFVLLIYPSLVVLGFTIYKWFDRSMSHGPA